jgi:hypothetical protein
MFSCFNSIEAGCAAQMAGTLVGMVFVIAFVVTAAKTCWPCRVMQLCLKCSTLRLKRMALEEEQKNENEVGQKEGVG